MGTIRHCSNCGYPLTGIASSQCPECGAFPPSEQELKAAARRRFWRRTSIVISLAVVHPIVVLCAIGADAFWLLPVLCPYSVVMVALTQDLTSLGVALIAAFSTGPFYAIVVAFFVFTRRVLWLGWAVLVAHSIAMLFAFLCLDRL